MYATVRHYENAKALSDAMAAAPHEVKEALSVIPGFITYIATREGDSVTSITICENKEACDESTRVAREWVKSHVSSPLSPPVINDGEAFINFSK
jgi:hypothetical protein